jgi:hypothetical protein
MNNTTGEWDRLLPLQLDETGGVIYGNEKAKMQCKNKHHQQHTLKNHNGQSTRVSPILML